MKRKKITLDNDSLYKESDFKKRYNKSFSRGLRDFQDYSQFTLNEFALYTDDPNEEIYEIISSDLDSTRYLVFTFSAVKSSLAYDEETLYQESEMTLELLPTNMPSNFQSRVSSHWLSLIMTLLAIIIFIAVSYLLILPDHVKNRVFGLNENPKAS